jgi:antitoxin component of MazEF toxin-antitoxin module
MTEVFEAKVRKVGNSLGIIIPREIVDTVGLHQGDMIPVCIPSAQIEKRNKAILEMARCQRMRGIFDAEADIRIIPYPFLASFRFHPAPLLRLIYQKSPCFTRCKYALHRNSI